jgi:hypothetical protein
MPYTYDQPHEFHPLSRRKPHTCSTCLRDIAHRFHQNSLAVEMTEEQRQEADARSAAELSQEMRAPLDDINKRTGDLERNSPLFAGTEASGQVRLF